ncbi:endonuclease III [candidate division KSB1 bacterium]|nr:endonuclease III [candidate division KSB1 bacterium]
MAEKTQVKKDRLKQIIIMLNKEFPDSKCSLNFTTPLELLTATVLSAQCTDERVNKVTPGLFKKYPSPKHFAEVSLEDLGNDIRSTGFFNNKSKSIQNCCIEILEKFDGEVPGNMDDLVSLPGIGRKTANVILGNIFGIPGIVVDTHVKRLSNRLELSENNNPDKIEKDLNEVVPEEKWTHFSHLLIDHGRKTCQARKPLCGQCPINRLCPSSEV